MVTQTTVGRRSEYHGESVIHSRQSGRVVHLPVKTGVIPHKDYNNIPAPAVVERTVRPPAVVYRQIRIGMAAVIAQESEDFGQIQTDWSY